MKLKLPIHCPSCEKQLSVTELSCLECKTKVSGAYSLPLLLQISEEEQQFILDFFMSSGSLKEMANQMGKSYPTVRNKLDDIIEKIKNLKTVI
ncbi:DUF2089 family protein [Flavobacterium sp.]|uniref:DUF2089 family protein n=1 Tax=Flavobacterium sp. TaxID=239 RepID=UPI00260C9808|nr:DUF2089 family protein [Flavobacterium sp.]MDD3003642.1 DUF2089 family protein [Flavobacterium sp.]